MASRPLRLSQIPPPWSWSFGRPSAQLLCEVCSVRSCPQLLQMWANRWIQWVRLDWQLEWQRVDGVPYWVARSAGTSALRVAYSHTSPGGTLNSCPVPQKHRIASFDINIINMCNKMTLLDNINLEMHYTHKSLILECKMSQETVLQIAKWWETVYRKKQPMNTNWLIACSRRWHGQDKTVLSCPCRRCEQALRFVVVFAVHRRRIRTMRSCTKYPSELPHEKLVFVYNRLQHVQSHIRCIHAN